MGTRWTCNPEGDAGAEAEANHQPPEGWVLHCLPQGNILPACRLPTAPGAGHPVGMRAEVLGTATQQERMDRDGTERQDDGERDQSGTPAVTSRPQAFCVGWLRLSYGDNNLSARVPRFEITNRVGDFA